MHLLINHNEHFQIQNLMKDVVLLYINIEP